MFTATSATSERRPAIGQRLGRASLFHAAGHVLLRSARWLLTPVESYVRALVRDELLTRPRVFGDPARLKIAPMAVVQNALFNLSSGTITVEPYAFFGHHVSLLTGRHDYRKLGLERQETFATDGRDIVVETGAWIATNATILGPCVIGKHAVVAAGAVVDEDVPPYTIVAGVPARIIGRVDPEERTGDV